MGGGGSGSRLTFSYSEFGNDPCQGNSVTRCPSIYFRLVGVDSGGLRCLTEEKLPCRTATAAQVTVTHIGMKCGASGLQSFGLFVLLSMGGFLAMVTGNAAGTVL